MFWKEKKKKKLKKKAKKKSIIAWPGAAALEIQSSLRTKRRMICQWEGCGAAIRAAGAVFSFLLQAELPLTPREESVMLLQLVTAHCSCLL